MNEVMLSVTTMRKPTALIDALRVGEIIDIYWYKDDGGAEEALTGEIVRLSQEFIGMEFVFYLPGVGYTSEEWAIPVGDVISINVTRGSAA